jgi:hypothetical protein
MSDNKTIAPRNLPSKSNNQSVPALLLEPFRQTEQVFKALDALARERDYYGLADACLYRTEGYLARAWQALVEVERSAAAFELMMGPASDDEIALHFNRTFACWPDKGDEHGVRMEYLLEDVGEERPSRQVLIYACRHLRKTHKFRPAISEVIDALKVARQHALRLERLREVSWLRQELYSPEQRRAQNEADARQRLRRLIEDDWDVYRPYTYSLNDLHRLGLLGVEFDELQELTQDEVLQRLDDAEGNDE